MAKYVKDHFQSLNLIKNRKIPARSYFLNFSKYNSIPKLPTERRLTRKVDLAKCLNMKVGDLVQVLHGQDKDKQGILLKIFNKKNQAIVENCNMRETFWNPSETGPSLITQEMPIHITNISLVDPVVKKPTIVKRRYMMNGECVRICKLSGCSLPEPIEITKNKYRKPPRKTTPIKAIYSHRDFENFGLLTKFARYIKDKKIAMLLSSKR